MRKFLYSTRASFPWQSKLNEALALCSGLTSTVFVVCKRLYIAVKARLNDQGSINAIYSKKCRLLF